ncbi:MAG: PspC domain-containing protein [Paludibacter sp.]|nr:PspC domain-containing protein [Paludibacter sp.]
MEKKLRRSNDKMLAGVCAGIADYFGLEISLVRIGYVALSIFSAGFPGLILYIAMALIIPQQLEN